MTSSFQLIGQTSNCVTLQYSTNNAYCLLTIKVQIDKLILLCFIFPIPFFLHALQLFALKAISESSSIHEMVFLHLCNS